jgi:VanZ family protein
MAKTFSWHKRILWILIFLYILWIFSNSIQTGSQSGSLSEEVARFLLPIVEKTGFTIDFSRFHFYVRKAAHFSEYALLGFLVILAIHQKPLCRPAVLNYLIFLVLPPLIDETIQLFSPGRSGMFTDCLIDMSGNLAGSFLMYILILIAGDLKRKFSDH